MLMDLWDVWSLRHRAGLTQQRAADLAGVSLRTWRRWERGETRVPTLVLRWLRLEAGQLPGWPRELAWERSGVRLRWSGYLVRHSVIEATPYLLQLLGGDDREAFAATVSVS